MNERGKQQAGLLPSSLLLTSPNGRNVDSEEVRNDDMYITMNASSKQNLI